MSPRLCRLWLTCLHEIYRKRVKLNYGCFEDRCTTAMYSYVLGVLNFSIKLLSSYDLKSQD